ncbi:MAG: ubiquinol-cytochrome c reductase iron-sulfur subunit [Actinomycetes bacterium]|jgi:ubiquinol-cytochrome c reductase iron-sulfur subunit
MSKKDAVELGAHDTVDEAAEGSKDVVLPDHHLRRTDFDPRAAKRAERQITTLFALSAVFTVLFLIAYVQIDTSDTVPVPFFGTWSASNAALGVTFGMASFLIGAGVMQWAKKLMSDREVAAPRHALASPPEAREEAVAAYQDGVDDSGFATRRILRRSLLAAMALFPIPLVVILRDLGTLPSNSLYTTNWVPGERVVLDVTGAPIRPSDIPLGGIVSAMPANLPEIQEEAGNLNARAKDVVLLVRMNPDEIRSQQGGTADTPWDYEGVMCFSKICTHVGCPIALYEQRSHHLLCPCHQSTFDLADSGRVIFGPAARDLPQLPIMLDGEGYIIARETFQEPIGPSFWERA